MFGLWEQFSLPTGIATLPVALWEFSLGVWLVVKGFNPSPITAGMVTAGTRPADQTAAILTSTIRPGPPRPGHSPN
jgi:hypothetical protein